MDNTNSITITNDYPTPILKDFERFLDYIPTKGIKLTKANEYLPRKDLFALYELMTDPKLAVHARSNQPGFAILHLFCTLGLELRLLQKNRTASGATLMLDPKRIADFQSLTVSEQYVTLLDCFWQKANWRDLEGGYFERAPENIDILFKKLAAYPANSEIRISEDEDLRRMLYNYEHFLFYFEFFGLWKVEINEEASRRVSTTYNVAKTLVLTPFFKQIQDALEKNWRYSRGGSYQPSIDMVGVFGMADSVIEKMIRPVLDAAPKPELFALLQPRFAEGELNRLLPEPDPQAPVIGKYIFKVSLHRSCWRTIQLSESHTLLDLHQLIQHAFDFDDDHLFAFYMDGKKYGQKGYYSPLDMGVPFANEIKIQELQLSQGQRFLYLFDFGDEWEFSVEVYSITKGKPKSKAVILDGVGASPAQYRTDLF